jgi:hypothetical protein
VGFARASVCQGVDSATPHKGRAGFARAAVRFCRSEQWRCKHTLVRALPFRPMAVGAVLIYCFWLILATGAFWIVHMWFLADLYEGVYQTGR